MLKNSELSRSREAAFFVPEIQQNSMISLILYVVVILFTRRTNHPIYSIITDSINESYLLIRSNLSFCVPTNRRTARQ